MQVRRRATLINKPSHTTQHLLQKSLIYHYIALPHQDSPKNTSQPKPQTWPPSPPSYALPIHPPNKTPITNNQTHSPSTQPASPKSPQTPAPPPSPPQQPTNTTAPPPGTTPSSTASCSPSSPKPPRPPNPQNPQPMAVATNSQ
jgi:hypothetical protein